MDHHERKQLEKQNMKKRILKAALRIASKDGWQAVTIRKISAAVHYTTSVVYEHFKNKDELLQELTNQGFQMFGDELDKAAISEENPGNQLLELSLFHWDFLQKNKALYQLMFIMKKLSGANAQMGMGRLKELFSSLTGKEEVHSFIMNWVCLRAGSIQMMIDFDEGKNSNNEKADPGEFYIEFFMDRFINMPDGRKKTTRELYIEFMKRFINSIAMKSP